MTHLIYKITNKINTKCYIGQSVNVSTRWRDHKSSAEFVKNGRKTIKDNGIQVIHLAMAKHGIESFEFKIIEEVDTQDQANDKEAYWILYYDSFGKGGYNCTPGGSNAPKTEEWKRKVKATRMANGGYGHSEETKSRMSEEWSLYHTPEQMEKCHAANRGRKLSEEHVQALVNANTGNKYCLGHKQSEKTIRKRMDAINAQYGSKICNVANCDRTDGFKVDGIRFCVKHAERMRNTGSLELGPRPKPNLGKTLSEETKKKISKSKRGQEPINKIKFSDEEIQVIITDSRPSRAIAKSFGISKRVILRIRREHG